MPMNQALRSKAISVENNPDGTDSHERSNVESVTYGIDLKRNCYITLAPTDTPFVVNAFMGRSRALALAEPAQHFRSAKASFARFAEGKLQGLVP